MVYLRPETAQGIYVNYQNVLNASRQKVPFGIAQIGKAFRNEITPGNFIFRTREFEQMEMQFFVKPGTDEEWFERWREWRMAWHHSHRPRSGQAPLAPARAGRTGPLRQGRLRHRVRVPLRLERDRGHPQPQRLRPAAATRSSPARSSSTSTRPPTSATSPTSWRPRPGADRVDPHPAGRCLPRGGGRGRDPRRARVPSRGGADQGGGIATGQEGRDAGGG